MVLTKFGIIRLLILIGSVVSIVMGIWNIMAMFFPLMSLTFYGGFLEQSLFSIGSLLISLAGIVLGLIGLYFRNKIIHAQNNHEYGKYIIILGIAMMVSSYHVSGVLLIISGIMYYHETNK